MSDKLTEAIAKREAATRRNTGQEPVAKPKKDKGGK